LVAAATFRGHRHPSARFVTVCSLAAPGLIPVAAPAATKKVHHKAGAEPEAIATSVPAAPEMTEAQRAFKSIEWTPGPAKVSIGSHAELQVPAGIRERADHLLLTGHQRVRAESPPPAVYHSDAS